MRKEFAEYCKFRDISHDIRSTFGTMKDMINFMEESYGKTFKSKES